MIKIKNYMEQKPLRITIILQRSLEYLWVQLDQNMRAQDF